jgi:hypothetical protein
VTLRLAGTHFAYRSRRQRSTQHSRVFVEIRKAK